MSQLSNFKRTLLENTFKSYDANGDGKVSLPELVEIIKQTGVEEAQKEAEAMFRQYDLNNDGQVTLEEFVEYAGAV